jgi:hypothetical protein
MPENYLKLTLEKIFWNNLKRVIEEAIRLPKC